MIPTHERMVGAATVSSISGMFRRAEQGPYTIPELHRYVGFSGGPHTSVNLPIEAKNVILLIVESLSSMDSAKISGIENQLQILTEFQPTVLFLITLWPITRIPKVGSWGSPDPVSGQ